MATKRNENGKGEWTLSPTMETAADLLALGKTKQAVADAIGAERSTVSQWANHHLGFIARVNQRRCDLWSESCAQMRSMVVPALDALATYFTDPEIKPEVRIRAIETVLKSVGLDSLILPDPDECSIEGLKVAQAKLANRLSHDKLLAEMMNT